MSLEIVNPHYPRGPFRAALFDFDGTLSLLRRNWQHTMIPMMVEVLAATGTPETPAELAVHVEEFVMRLNGRRTLDQMLRLADEVRRRGATPLDPQTYKHEYLTRLAQQVEQRVEAVRQGAAAAETMSVPGARALLTQLQAQGLALYLASGTDVDAVRAEATVLGLAEFFGPRIYGPGSENDNFSKARIVEQMQCELGPPVLGLGDGVVETEEVKKVGGLAIGVASNEDTRTGVNAWKRQRLIGAGADIIVGDYRDLPALLEVLGAPPAKA